MLLMYSGGKCSRIWNLCKHFILNFKTPQQLGDKLDFVYLDSYENN